MNKDMNQIPSNTPRLGPKESIKLLNMLNDQAFSKRFSAAMQSNSRKKVAKVLKDAGIKVSTT